MNARSLLLIAAPLFLAITMPSCPGQEETKAALEQHQGQLTSMTKRLVELENQVKALNADMAQAKTFLPQMAQAIQAQKTQLDAIEAKLTELTAKKGKKK